jgi:hypothetical protein
MNGACGIMRWFAKASTGQISPIVARVPCIDNTGKEIVF